MNEQHLRPPGVGEDWTYQAPIGANIRHMAAQAVAWAYEYHHELTLQFNGVDLLVCWPDPPNSGEVVDAYGTALKRHLDEVLTSEDNFPDAVGERLGE